MSRRMRWTRVAGAVVTVYSGVVILVPLPFVVLSPGPTYDTIGSSDGTPVIEVTGRKTYPTDGELRMTTVNQRGGPFGRITGAQALWLWRDPASRVLPQEALFPEEVTAQELADEGRTQFIDSQGAAVAAAATHLDIPVTTHVVLGAVVPDGPSADVLRADDLINTINGVRVSTPDDVASQLTDTSPGERIALEIDRKGKQQSVEVTLGASPRVPGRGYLGVLLGVTYQAPFDVDFTLGQVGGPSAGLMFTLGLIDTLTPQSLTGGRDIAGTGTITPDGVVGPIGGIEQKMLGAQAAGATLFLAPAENCPEAVEAIPDGLTVAAVADIDQALDAIEAYVSGRVPAACTP